MASLGTFKRLRPLGAVAFIALGVLVTPSSAASARERNPHNEAVSGLGDISAAIKELTDAADLTVSAADPYKRAAQRALNALIGKSDPDFQSKAGNPGDDAGALGHLNWLHGQPGSHAWDAPLQASLVNVTVAKGQLKDAIQADEFDEFQARSSDALEALLIALGRDADLGALGALRGALATTDLGVPLGAKTVPGCAPPPEAPAFGVVKGYLTYVAVPEKNGPNRLPVSLGVRDVSVGSGFITLHTAATDMLNKLCPQEAAKDAHSNPSSLAPSDPRTPAGPAKLYTQAQAEAGKQVYAQHCMACHGDHLEGKSAPAIGGSAFLKKAKMLDWSVGDLRSLIVTTMPRDNPGSLSPKQYADVIAYLLANDCYPAGQNKFPADATPQIKSTDLRPLQVKEQKSDLGTCPLQAGQPGQNQ